MKSRGTRRRGKTHAIVRSERSVEHLDATSETHARDKALAAKARERVAGVVVVPDMPPEALKFPSLRGGVMLGPDGAELTSEEHAARLNALRIERGHYLVTQRRADGREYQRKRKTDGLRQLAVTYRPEHALTFARLERVGLGVRRAVVGHALALSAEFVKLTGYPVEAVQIHPEEGSLHLHLTYSTVKDGRLLHAVGGVGRKGLRLAGPSVIGTLRLVGSGIWPEADGVLARSWLSDRKKGGADPVDFVLSEYLDGLGEKSLVGLSARNATAREVWSGARRDYEAAAKASREARPDVLAAKVEGLEAERAQLVDELAKVRAELEAAKAAGGWGRYLDPTRPGRGASPGLEL